jgi:SAM-dependent methyltransferase
MGLERMDRHRIKRFVPPAMAEAFAAAVAWNERRGFRRHGCIPWTRGYGQYRERVVREALASERLTDTFRSGGALPSGYGIGVDERCIEYPWLMANISSDRENCLDAGSALNHSFLIEHPVWNNKVLHIMTLAPERESYLSNGVSYLFGDLRDIPIRDGFYGTVACVSTLEHVGFDNATYTSDRKYHERRPDDFLVAIAELDRVLRPGGRLLITVPFGAHRDYGTFQQFDHHLLQRAIESVSKIEHVVERFYRYGSSGWELSRAEECGACEYAERALQPQPKKAPQPSQEPDLAAAARAVACVEILKG